MKWALISPQIIRNNYASLISFSGISPVKAKTNIIFEIKITKKEWKKTIQKIKLATRLQPTLALQQTQGAEHVQPSPFLSYKRPRRYPFPPINLVL